MPEPSTNFIYFKGVLLQKTPLSEEFMVRLWFLTPKGNQTIIAYNPLLTAALQVGVTYRIRGHVRTEKGVGYIRLMSARPVVETESVFVKHNWKIMSGSASLAVLAMLAVVSVFPSSGPSPIVETQSKATVAIQHTTSVLQESLGGVLPIAPAKQAEVPAPAAPNPETASMPQAVVPQIATIPPDAANPSPQQTDQVSDVAAADALIISDSTTSTSSISVEVFQPSHSLQVSDSSQRPTLADTPESDT